MRKLKMFLMSALLMIGLVSIPTLNAEVVGNSKLESLTVSAGTLSPEFKDDGTADFTVEVENNVEKISITATAGTGLTVEGGNVVDAQLEAGKSTPFTITVKNADDSEVSTYTVTVTRKAATPVEPTEPTDEEKMNELIKDIEALIASDDELKDIVEVTGYYGKTISFEYSAVLEDGTLLKSSTSVTVEEYDASKVITSLKENLDNSELEIVLPESNVITNTVLELMKLVGQTFYFSGNADRYVEWEIDGSKITDVDNELDLNVLVGEEVTEDIRKAIESLLVDKTKSLVVDFAHSGNLPEGTNVSMYVGDKFKEGDVLSLFYYNPTTKKLEETVKNIKVFNDGYVQFNLEHCSSYVLVKTTNNAATGTTNVILYSGIMVIALAGIVVLFKKKNN